MPISLIYISLIGQLELILDFDEEIAGASVLVVKAGNENGDTDEVVHDAIDDVSDTVLTIVAFDIWVEAQVITAQLNTDFENRGKHVLHVVLDVDLVSHAVHVSINRIGNTLMIS